MHLGRKLGGPPASRIAFAQMAMKCVRVTYGPHIRDAAGSAPEGGRRNQLDKSETPRRRARI